SMASNGSKLCACTACYRRSMSMTSCWMSPGSSSNASARRAPPMTLVRSCGVTGLPPKARPSRRDRSGPTLGLLRCLPDQRPTIEDHELIALGRFPKPGLFAFEDVDGIIAASRSPAADVTVGLVFGPFDQIRVGGVQPEGLAVPGFKLVAQLRPADHLSV